MMSGQFPDEILDPAIRKLGWRFGVVPDREALRGRLEQEVGFADYGKYTREQLIEGLRRLQRLGGQTELPDGIVLRPEDLGDLAEHVHSRFPEPGPQSGLLQAPGSSLAAAYESPTLPTDAAPEPLLRPLSPALSARVHALLSSQGEPSQGSG
jgi:hypothetical protein